MAPSPLQIYLILDRFPKQFFEILDRSGQKWVVLCQVGVHCEYKMLKSGLKEGK